MRATHPPTIQGRVEDRLTGAITALTARRTGVIEDGCEVYVVVVPMPGEWMRQGRIRLRFDLMPGRSSFHLQFQSEDDA